MINQLFNVMRSAVAYLMAYVWVLLIHFMSTSVYAKYCMPFHSKTWTGLIINNLYTAMYSNSEFCIGTKYIMDSTSNGMAGSTSSICQIAGTVMAVKAIVGMMQSLAPKQQHMAELTCRRLAAARRPLYLTNGDGV